MSLYDPHAFTVLGNPVDPACPAVLRAVGGPASAELMTLAQQQFYKHCMLSRLSVVPNPREAGRLSDGTRYEIVTVGITRTMTVWPEDDDSGTQWFNCDAPSRAPPQPPFVPSPVPTTGGATFTKSELVWRELAWETDHANRYSTQHGYWWSIYLGDEKIGDDYGTMTITHHPPTEPGMLGMATITFDNFMYTALVSGSYENGEDTREFGTFILNASITSYDGASSRQVVGTDTVLSWYGYGDYIGGPYTQTTTVPGAEHPAAKAAKEMAASMTAASYAKYYTDLAKRDVLVARIPALRGQYDWLILNRDAESSENGCSLEYKQRRMAYESALKKYVDDVTAFYNSL